VVPEDDGSQVVPMFPAGTAPITTAGEEKENHKENWRAVRHEIA
jgi:hypothetical protein